MAAGGERRFNRNGESWIARHCYRGPGEFKIQDILHHTVPGPSGGFVSTARIPSIDIDKIVYFASSMFWRAATGAWNNGAEQLSMFDFDSSYEEAFREFLLGRAGFPEHAALIVQVSSDVLPLKSTTDPYGDRGAYFFHIPGLHFSLFVGEDNVRSYRDTCVVRSPKHLIYWGDTNSQIREIELSQHRRSRPIGRLAQQYPRPSA